MKKKELDNKRFSRGVYFMTASLLIAKFLGFLFIVPFVYWVGEQNYILYEYAYKPYAIMLMVATMGVPGAVSKYVSKYNELDRLENVKSVFRLGIFTTIVFGTIAFFILYYSSDFLSELLISGGSGGNTPEDVSRVIKLVSFALLVVPLLSFFRGFIQGHKDMTPSSVSQLTEQFTRVGLILISTFILVEVLKKDPKIAIDVSVLSAFIAALVALLTMLYYLKKRSYIPKGNGKSVEKRKVFLELSIYVVPFIFVGSSITVFQTIDTFTINSAMMLKGYSLSEAENVNAIVSLIQKLIFLPIALATSLSASLIPYITSSYHKGDIQGIRENIVKSVYINMFFVLPVSISYILISKPIYGSVFGMNNAFIGGDILSWYGLLPVFLSIYTLTASILQGMNKNKWIIVSLVLGVIIKLVSNKPLILIYDGVGTAFSNYLGFGVMILIQAYVISKEAKFNWSENIIFMKDLVRPNIALILFLLPVGMLSMSFESYLEIVISCAIGVLIGSSLYLYACKKSGSLSKIIKDVKK